MESVISAFVLIVLALLIALVISMSCFFSAQRESIDRCSKILRGDKDV